MKRFALLIEELNAITKTNEKIKALVRYFQEADKQDIMWVIALFTGRRPKRAVSSTLMREWISEYCQLPSWLVNESYLVVGDLSETVALLLEPFQNEQPATDKSLTYYVEALQALIAAPEDERKSFMLRSWAELHTTTERFVFNKLLSGSFRIGVSQQLVIQALSQVSGQEPSVLTHKLSGHWTPQSRTYDELISDDAGSDASRPYPFYLAYPLEQEPEELGALSDWQIEWKWDGIRAQIILRHGQFFIWSRGDELLTDRMPELQLLQSYLPEGTVLDGEIVVVKDDRPAPFALLQKRIGRKNLSKQILEEAPVKFYAYDLLELDGKELRQKPMAQRRRMLEEILVNIPHPAIKISPIVEATNWSVLSRLQHDSRSYAAEGFMLKHKDSVYETGRKRGRWWKWKVDPFSIDAVLIYAQKGSGRRSNLYTDYTFALRDGTALVPFAKAYSGLTDKEMAQVDAFVKRNALEKFGPVRTVKPELVFELGFEGIAASTRHKSGVAVRFPRILRWRRDKSVEEINTLDDLKTMMAQYGSI